MLDSRLYRAAFVPLFFVLLIVAFSLTVRPRPIGTTLSPDTFSGERAFRQLDDLAERFPDRRPGSAGDRALAAAIATELRRTVPGTVEETRFQGRTIDGKRNLVNVTATRPGAPGPAVVVVAHRDAAGTGARAELSGTAALLELARVAGAGRLQRTITFISTTGGSGGFAGAVKAARELDGPVDAVIVLGPIAAVGRYRPMVVGTSNGLGQAPLQLQRTIQLAVERQAGVAPGSPRAFIQGLRMAAPMTLGEQGPFLRAGLPAVLVSPIGERSPGAAAAVSTGRLDGFGRAVLGALYALDNGPDISGEKPTEGLVLRGKVVPAWAMRLLVLALLLPPLAVSIDAAARLRRRREPLTPWVVWALSPAVPIIAVCVTAILLSVTGLIRVSTGTPLPPAALSLTTSVAVAICVLLLVAGLAWLVVRPAVLGAAGLHHTSRPDRLGAGVAVALVISIVALLLWIPNPYAAGAMVPAAHLWLWAAAPESGIRRPVAALCLVLGGVLPLIVVVVLSQLFSLSVLQTPWFWTLLVAGGHQPWWTWLLWSMFWGAGIAAALIVARRSALPDVPPPITVRGPASYAGPGSLGGTTSARRG